MEGDTPIKRKTFLEMTELEQIAFTDALRRRRLEPINAYNEAVNVLRLKKESKIRDKLAKEIKMFEKCLEACNKKLDELENRSNKIKTLKIQLEIE